MRLTAQELQELCNDAHDDAAEEIRELRAQLAAAEARAGRLATALEWVRRKLFVQSWGGTLGAPSDWRIAGDYRHTTQRMKGPTLLDAISHAPRLKYDQGVTVSDPHCPFSNFQNRLGKPFG